MSVVDLSMRAYGRFREGGVSAVAESARWYLQSLSEIPSTYVRQRQYKTSFPDATPPPYQILDLDPDEIEYMTLPSFDDTKASRGTHVIGGDWDENRLDDGPFFRSTLVSENDRRGIALFSNYILYRGMTNYLKDGVPWRETEYYQKMHRRGRSEEKLEAKRKKVTRMYDKIDREGYLRQRDHDRPKKPQGPAEIDEMKIDIGRHGRFILDDGLHRLSIAKILECDSIPVRVYVRHTKWQEIREEVGRSSDETSFSRRANSFLDHPDMQDVLTGGSIQC